jgi:hypothetical protein
VAPSRQGFGDKEEARAKSMSLAMAYALLRTARGPPGAGPLADTNPPVSSPGHTLTVSDCAARMLLLRVLLDLGRPPSRLAALSWVEACSRFPPVLLRENMQLLKTMERWASEPQAKEAGEVRPASPSGKLPE